MADFDALPVYDGVGDFHLNRFRIAFQCPAEKTQNGLATDFRTKFPQYLKSDYATTDDATGRKFGDKDTLKFWGSMKLLGLEANFAGVHHDWVAKQSTSSGGFTAQTLKRNFFDIKEDLAAGGGGGGAGSIIATPLLGPIVGPIVSGMGANKAISINRMHFLAGRRSWRIDTLDRFGVTADEYGSPDTSNKTFILETAAVERLSSEAFEVAEAIVGVEKRIPPVWIANLDNFVTQNAVTGFKPLPIGVIKRSGWKTSAAEFPVMKDNYVTFYRESFTDLAALKSDYEFTEVIRLYPDILP